MQKPNSVYRCSSFAIATVLAATAAGCVDGSSSDGVDDLDDAELGAALQDLGSHKPAFDPLIPQDNPAGEWVYDQLGKEWVRWVMKLPVATHPILDTTGEFCGLGQSGPVWYLAGTFGTAETRDCDVPRGKFLYFPLLNAFGAVPSDAIDDTNDEAFWIAAFTDFFTSQRAATCELTLRYDGHEVLSGTAERDARLYTEVLDPFPVFLNETDNLFGHYPGGVWPLGFNGGHYALFLPPTAGDHILELGGKTCADGVVTNTVSATYRLHVH